MRNGLDVAFSLADPRRHYPAIDAAVEAAGGDVPSGAGRFWSMQNRKILDFTAAHPEACVRITYEDLTRDPGVTLEPAFSFLGRFEQRQETAQSLKMELVDHGQLLQHAGVAAVVRQFVMVFSATAKPARFTRPLERDHPRGKYRDIQAQAASGPGDWQLALRSPRE